MDMHTTSTPLAVLVPAILLLIITLGVSIIATIAIGVGAQSYVAGGVCFAVIEGGFAFFIDTLVMSYLGTGIIGGVKLWLSR